MPEISACPKCQRLVSVPQGVDSAARVRCPLCEAEYCLSEAVPPELIPVDPAAEEEPENEATAVVGPAPIGITQRRRRPPKPWWKTLRDVVTGGLAGCLLAYYGLAFYLGPRFNLPKYSFLPFIAQWTAPVEKTDGAAEKPATEKPAERRPAEGKPAPKASDGPK